LYNSYYNKSEWKLASIIEENYTNLTKNTTLFNYTTVKGLKELIHHNVNAQI
jgi:hypothetical protein